MPDQQFSIGGPASPNFRISKKFLHHSISHPLKFHICHNRRNAREKNSTRGGPFRKIQIGLPGHDRTSTKTLDLKVIPNSTRNEILDEF